MYCQCGGCKDCLAEQKIDRMLRTPTPNYLVGKSDLAKEMATKLNIPVIELKAQV